MKGKRATWTTADHLERLGHFSVIFIPVLLLCAVALGSVMYSDYSRLKSGIESEQSRLVNLVTTSLQNTFDTLRNQIRSLTREVYLLQYIDGRPGAGQALAQRYHTIAVNAPVIDRVQIIDAAGNELLGVVSEAERKRLLADAELQNLAAQTYFQQAMQMPAGSQYVSAVTTRAGDAQGRPVSVMTVASPLFDDQDERWGVLAVSIYAQPLLQAVLNVAEQSGFEFWVLNRNGDTITGPDTGGGQGLVETDPSLWALLSGGVTGQPPVRFRHEGDLYARLPVCPDLSCRISYSVGNELASDISLDLPESGWLIVSRVPASSLSVSALLMADRATWLPLSLLLVAVTLLVGWVAWRTGSNIVILHGKEAQLSHLNQELQDERSYLEQRVRERTVALAEATERAEAANRAKSSFLATMSHEIRTPMNGVIGSIDVLRRSSLRPRQLELAALIRDSAYSLLTIIDDILDFSKIEADRIVLEREPVSLSYIVDSVCNAMQALAAKKNVELHCYCTPTVPDVILSDSVRLRQIVNNLVSNAIKFSSSDERQGRVELRFESRDDASLVMSIKDNGIGMSEDSLAVVFDAFCQADASTTRRFGGTGLGLAITRRLVELMQGRIDVNSQPGVGTEFLVHLPLELAEAAAEQPRCDLKGVSCFLLGADQLQQEAWSSWLTSLGAELHEVSRLADIQVHLQRIDARQRRVMLAPGTAPSIEELEAYLATQASDALEYVVAVRPLPEARAQILSDTLVIIGSHASHSRVLQQFLDVLAGNAKHLIDDEEPETEDTPRPLDRAHAISLGRLVLVAEDNEVNQDVIRSQLGSLGYACDVVTHGLEALALWQSQGSDYALLLTDLHMPVMDGYELTEAIRSQEGEARHLPILAFTADATKGEKTRCLEAGMDDYLIKPLALDVLKEKLSAWTGGADLAAASPATDTEGSTAGAAFDTSVLRQYVGDDPQRIRQFLEKYLESIHAARQQLHETALPIDWQAIRQLAHKLKSSSRAVGALQLAALCEKLEKNIRDDRGAVAEQAISELRRSLESTRVQLARHLEG